MRNKRFFILVCMLLCLTIFLTGCPNPYVYGRHPVEQPLTTWRSEDGSIVFYVPEDSADLPEGTIKIDDQTIDVTFNITTVETRMSVVLTDSIRKVDGKIVKEYVLSGNSKVISKTAFKITVQRSDYFPEGTVFVFNRVDE